MKRIGEYKDAALATLKGRWSDAVIITLIYFAVTYIFGLCLSGIGTVTKVNAISIVSILLLPLMWGYAIFFLNLVRNDNAGKNTLFDGFKSGKYGRLFTTLLIGTLIEAVGFALFIIPGIILALMYSQVCFIMKDDENIKNMDALKLSADMMKGHKMELFWLTLSFIGWLILAMITFGIGMLWLNPYIYTTLAHYYEDLKADYAARQNGAAVQGDNYAK